MRFRDAPKLARIPTARIDAFRRRLLFWFDTAGRQFPWRSADATPYIQVLTELLVQQTRAENVAATLPKIVKRYPGWEALSAARIADLESFLRPLGLWRRRAKAIKNLAIALRARKWQWPVARDDLETLPAVGQYVASAVRIFIHREREPLLDTNMARLLERYFGPRVLVDIRYDPGLQSLARRLVIREEPRRVNRAVLDFDALVCTARKPRCLSCPLRRGCLFFKRRNSATIE